MSALESEADLIQGLSIGRQKGPRIGVQKGPLYLRSRMPSARPSGAGSCAAAKAATSRTIALALVAILIAGIAILIQPRISAQEKDDFPLLFQVSTFAADNFFSFLG